MKIDIPAIQAKLQALLQGDSLRAISYGAIAVVFVVSRIEVQLGWLADTPDLTAITVAVGAAVTALTELIHRYVYSATTVAVALDVPVEHVAQVVDFLVNEAPTEEAPLVGVEEI